MCFSSMSQQEGRRFQCLFLNVDQKIVLVICSVHLRHVLESCGIDQPGWLAFLSSECGSASLSLNAIYLALIGTTFTPYAGLILRYVKN